MSEVVTVDQVAEAERRVAAWSPKPHAQFNY